MKVISIVVIALVIMLVFTALELREPVAAVAEYGGGTAAPGGTGPSSDPGSMPGTGAPLLIIAGGLAVAGVGALVARTRR